jgi:hypothetical protein
LDSELNSFFYAGFPKTADTKVAFVSDYSEFQEIIGGDIGEPKARKITIN